MVCDSCKKELRENKMYRELGMVLICNHKYQSITKNKCDTLRGKNES